MGRIFAGLFALFLLTGCQDMMSADVTRFYETKAAGDSGRTFAFAPEGNQQGSLEFQRYAGLLADALTRHGFGAPAADENRADLVVMMRYGSAGSRNEVYSWGGSFHDGYWGPGYGWRNYYDGGFESFTLFAQSLEVDVLDGPFLRQGGRRMVFQGRVIGESGIRDVNAAMPFLVQALFSDFPGPNGQTLHLRLPVGN